LKRYLFAALLVLTISAVAVMPAFAADACPDMTGMHAANVDSLIMHVQHAASTDMQHIDPTLVTALLAPLKTAANTTVNVAGRVGALQAFTNLVNAQAGKGINADCAKMLLTQAQSIVIK
jgi:hypothetical protein